MDKSYIDTVRLLLRVAPDVFAGDLFALKGGTAINLFVRDMPRLSVDLDLVFIDHTLPRAEALSAITAGRLLIRSFKKPNMFPPVGGGGGVALGVGLAVAPCLLK